MVKKNSFLMNTIFFLGWMLSPFTFWNDAFVNIPLSYILANLLRHFVAVDFLVLTLISYWATNILGILLMIPAGREIFRGKGRVGAELLKLAVTTIIYSCILTLLVRLEVLRPIF